jgi:phage shock protein A
MNLFTRLSATLTGKVEEFVSQVENHDAIVAIALKDTRAAVARARVQLDRVQKDGAKMRASLEEAGRKAALWEERARSTAASDENKALECIARRNQCREQITRTRTLLQQHEVMESRMRADLQHMEQRLGEITQQQNLMRSRQSTAEAMRVISKLGSQNAASAIEETFDRWEGMLSEAEYRYTASPADTLEAEFVSTENTAELKAELSALLNQNA